MKESKINSFDITADKEALEIASVKCPVPYCMKCEQLSVHGMSCFSLLYCEVEIGWDT